MKISEFFKHVGHGINPLFITRLRNIRSGIVHVAEDVEVYYDRRPESGELRYANINATPMCMQGRGWWGDGGKVSLSCDDPSYEVTYKQDITCKSCLARIKREKEYYEKEAA